MGTIEIKKVERKVTVGKKGEQRPSNIADTTGGSQYNLTHVCFPLLTNTNLQINVCQRNNITILQRHRYIGQQVTLVQLGTI